MFSVIARCSALRKAVIRIIQVSQVPSKNMGSFYSKSYSVSQFTPQPLQVRESTTDAACTGTICKMDAPDEYIESVVCNENDLQENEMKTFEIGDTGRVLLVKQKGEFNALGTKCTHYGAPLVKGALGDGRIRCPWHGACFNIKTGDIEDFPGFDSLPCYQVTVTEKGEVKVRAKISELRSQVHVKEIRPASNRDEFGVVIIGGGPSGATCAETLRNEGYHGRIIIVSKEPHIPYDRIKVSKLSNIVNVNTLHARSEEYYRSNNIEILKGVKATKVDTNKNLVHLSNNTSLGYNSLYIATGSAPKVPEIPEIHLKNIFTVRNYEDSVNILRAIGDERDKKVVVLGLGFIGLEMAAACVQKTHSLTVVGRDTEPLSPVFGFEIGSVLIELFEKNDVKFEFKTTINKCNGEDGCIQSVTLENGKTLPCDVLILGVGTTYNTKFLKDSGITLHKRGGVVVNSRLETNIPNVYAGGDIAYAPVFAADNKNRNIGHIGLSQYHGKVAALNIMKKDTPLHTVPYFWSKLFEKSIRYAGYGKPANSLIIGDIEKFEFVMFFFDEDEKVIAVASCMRDPVVSQFAELMHQGKSIYKKDLKENPFAWTSQILPVQRS